MDRQLAHRRGLEQLNQEASARIFLDVWEHNPGATQFYERYGFVVIGDRSFAVASGAETSLDLIMGQLSNALCVVVYIELY